MVHLCGRPVGPQRRCILGRETALQRVRWTEDGWPVLAHGSNEPQLDAIGVAGARPRGLSGWRDDFDDRGLHSRWMTLREPPDERWLSLSERPGCLRLRGRQSLSSVHDQSLVGARLQHHRCVVETSLSYAPDSFQQMAGLALYYHTKCYHYLRVSCEEGGRTLQVLSNDAGQLREGLGKAISLPASGDVDLRAELSGAAARFSYRCGPKEAWQDVGIDLDASILSDDYPLERNVGFGFTGAFVALCTQDFTGRNTPADFRFCSYRPEPA